jgi:hypothetical protein
MVPEPGEARLIHMSPVWRKKFNVELYYEKAELATPLAGLMTVIPRFPPVLA